MTHTGAKVDASHEPLMIGARDLAFPRLNAFGFWLTLFGGLLLYLSYLSERLGRRHF